MFRLFGRPKVITPRDDVPAPGGLHGVVQEPVYWTPPQGTGPYSGPFRYGRGYEVPFTYASMGVGGGQWTNQPLPDEKYETPWGVELAAHLWPVAAGSSGSYQKQLDLAGAPQQPVGIPMAQMMNQLGAAQSRLTSSPETMAGGFAST